MRKRPFDIDECLQRIEEAVRPFPKAAMFELAEHGYKTVFQQLIACILSIRTRDETSLPAALRLFDRAATPGQMVMLTTREIDDLIRTCTFHQAKAPQIFAIAEETLKKFGGELPCDAGVLTSFQGVGPKCAHLALGIACGQPVISVDIHVHRVTNRWGYVHAASPERTLEQLETVLPKRYWIDINRLLVPFGKNVCTGIAPKCSTCPVLDMCRQVGVTKHR